MTRPALMVFNRLGHYRILVLAVATIALAYGILVSCLIRTRLPWIDEAWVANPAWNLLENGRMVTTFFESANPDSNQTFSQATYWMPPGWFILEAGWFSVLGTGLYQQRALSALFGALLLVALYIVSSRLTGSKRVGLLTAFLTAIDFVFLDHAADGRMDVGAAACVMMTYALYLGAREINLTAALVLANTALVVAGLIHPIAIIGCGGFLCLILLLDRLRLRWAHLAWISIPYLLGGLAWGIYIARDPSEFAHQFFGKTPAPNFGFFTAFVDEMHVRYRHIFGLDLQWKVASWPQFLVGVTYASATIAALVGAVRTRKRRWILPTTLWGAHFIGLTLVISLKADYHLPSIIPLYALLLALCLDAAMADHRARSLAAVTLVALLALQLRIGVIRICLDPFQRYFAPTLAYVRSVPASKLVSAPPEFAYALGFPAHVLHDYHFGFYSGRKPDLVVSRQSSDVILSATQGSAEHKYIEDLFSQDYYLDRTIGIYRLYRPQENRPPRP